MTNDFEDKLRGLGIHFETKEGYYFIHSGIKIKLLASETTDTESHGSHNGLTIDAIGYFIIQSYHLLDEVEFVVFALPNSFNSRNEFIIITSEELKQRLMAVCYLKTKVADLHLKFWLMPERTLYETYDISVEGEWYMLSKGVKGRLADKTKMDYTQFLNSWSILINT